MTTATTAAVLLAAAFTTASANASVDMLADPQGNGNVDVLMGTDATQQDASSWRTMDDAPAVWTAWNGKRLTFSVTLPDDHSSADQYRLGLTAMNARGPLPGGYDSFNVQTKVGGQSVGTMKVAASDTEWNTTWIDLGSIAGAAGSVVPVQFMWTNDKYKKGVYDANIAYGGVQISRVGEPIPAPASLALAGAGGLLCCKRRRKA